MTRGGKRPGAGRKPGAVTKKSAAAASKLAKYGPLPLEILVISMRNAWAVKNVELACALADKCAPYFHAKISAKDAPVIIAGLAAGKLSERGEAAIAAMGRGELSPSQVADVLATLASQSRLVETTELERRIRAIEERFTHTGGSK